MSRLNLLFLITCIVIVFSAVLVMAYVPSPDMIVEPITRLDTPTDDPTFPLPLRLIVGDAVDGESAMRNVVSYFEANQAALAAEFGTTGRDMTAAVYSMVIIHMAVPYGATNRFPSSILDYATTQGYTHCGTSAHVQYQVADALGLQWRAIIIDNGDHVWLEMFVDGKWQIFDATTNVHIDASMYDLLEGAPRTYRQYMQSVDIPNCQSCRDHLDYATPLTRLSWEMYAAGIEWTPRAAVVIHLESE